MLRPPRASGTPSCCPRSHQTFQARSPHFSENGFAPYPSPWPPPTSALSADDRLPTSLRKLRGGPQPHARPPARLSSVLPHGRPLCVLLGPSPASPVACPHPGLRGRSQPSGLPALPPEHAARLGPAVGTAGPPFALYATSSPKEPPCQPHTQPSPLHGHAPTEPRRAQSPSGTQRRCSGRQGPHARPQGMPGFLLLYHFLHFSKL